MTNFDWHWHPDPGIIEGVVALCVLYAVAVGPARNYLAPGAQLPRWKPYCFGAAMILMLLAVASPLDDIAERYLFSAHMFQHILLIYPVALLWLWGMPDFVLRPLLEMEWSAPVLRVLTKPIVAFVVFNGLFYVWHLPPLYEWALRDSKIHFLEHASFIGGALLMWWPLVRPLPELPVFHPGGHWFTCWAAPSFKYHSLACSALPPRPSIRPIAPRPGSLPGSTRCPIRWWAR